MSYMDVANPVPVDVAAVQEIAAECNWFLGVTGAFLIRVAKLVWQNPNGATPQQVLAFLGTNAKRLFDDHAALAAMVGPHNPAVIVELQAITRPVTVHDDGTVTVA